MTDVEQNILCKSLADQYKRAFTMLRETCSKIPDGDWKKGPNRYLTPAGNVYHNIESIEFYLSDLPPDKFPFGARFGCDWEGSEPSALPSKGKLLDYLSEIEDNTIRKLNSLSDEDLTKKNVYKWTGDTYLSRLLYILRHTLHHNGELTAVQTILGNNEISWE